jgi:MHS family proline/betaine transporter-like MFS transporter
MEGSTSRSGLSRKSVVIAAMSTVVEWYDFTLHLYLATVLSRVFFGGGPASLDVLLVGFAVAYCMRPLGAVVLGYMGDRFGRRRMLLFSMAMMGLAMLGTGLLPTRVQMGPLAGALLLALRCLTAMSVGGEYIGVIAYLVEGAPVARRGLVAASAAAASEVGGLLAAATSAVTVGLLAPSSLDAWGWRIPFFVGAALAGVIWLARSAMEESPDFQRQPARSTVAESPLRIALVHNRSAMLRTFSISALGSIAYYVGITYVPTFLTAVGSLSEGDSLRFSSLAAIVVIFVTPLAGALSDHFGRRPVLICLAICCIVLPLGSFYIMLNGSHAQAMLAALALASVAGGVTAVGVPATAEQFPVHGRLSGLALSGTAATAVFGGAAPVVAQLLTERSSLAIAPGGMIAVVALAVLPVIIAMPETNPMIRRRQEARIASQGVDPEGLHPP